jgi:polar amino acid transport system substrate-binding protein
MMRNFWRLAAIAACFTFTGNAMAQSAGNGSAPADVITELAPTGRLRAAINIGNIVLAQKDAKTGALGGVSVEIAKELARRLGKPLDYVVYDTAGLVTDAIKDKVWDICFLAIDPIRGQGIDYTGPYVLIEGGYMVPAGSPLARIEEVDKTGTRIAVGKGSAYDLYLTRAIKNATLVRAPSSADAIDMFAKDKLEVAAGVKQPLVLYAKDHATVRVLDGRFMVIEQAMGTLKGREKGARYLRQMIEELKASGFVGNALKATNQLDAAVAPPTPVN